MCKYEIYKHDTNIDIYGYDQNFTEEDIKSLWDDHKILYMRGGIMAIWIEERKNNNPLLHLMGEDDGHIFWRKEQDISFDSGWLNNYIETLTETKNRIAMNKTEFYRR